MTVAVRRWNRCRSWQLHAQCLGEAVHRRRGAHGIAVAGRRCRRGDDVEEAGIVDFALRQKLAGLPDNGARARALAAEPAVQHRPDAEGDRRDVDGGRSHEERRRRLVAADGKHHAVEWIAVEDLDEAEVREIAIEAGGRALPGLLDRVHREFHRDAAGVADAIADAFGELDVVPVAGREVRSGLGDADNGLARHQLLAAKAEVQVALQVEGGHVRVGRIVEPGARAQAGCGLVGQGGLPPASAHRSRAGGLGKRVGLILAGWGRFSFCGAAKAMETRYSSGDANCGSNRGCRQWFTRFPSIWNRYGIGMETVLRLKESGLNR